MAPKTKRNRHRQTVEGCQTNAVDLPQDDILDHPPANMEYPMVPTTILQMTTWKNQKGTGARDRNRRKNLLPPIGTGPDSHRKQNKATIWIYCRPKQIPSYIMPLPPMPIPQLGTTFHDLLT